jgi:hypothetical protein
MAIATLVILAMEIVVDATIKILIGTGKKRGASMRSSFFRDNQKGRDAPFFYFLAGVA